MGPDVLIEIKLYFIETVPIEAEYFHGSWNGHTF